MKIRVKNLSHNLHFSDAVFFKSLHQIGFRQLDPLEQIGQPFAFAALVLRHGIQSTVQIVSHAQQIFCKGRYRILAVFFNLLRTAFFGIFGISISAQIIFLEFPVFVLQRLDDVVLGGGFFRIFGFRVLLKLFFPALLSFRIRIFIVFVVVIFKFFHLFPL